MSARITKPHLLVLGLSFVLASTLSGEVSAARAKARAKIPPAWIGLIGSDYNPNHYASGSPFNAHDVFYVGSNAAFKPITNVYAELSQLKAAGFNTVRSYQTDPYSWIEIIQSANALSMSVIYEAVIPMDGNQDSINEAETVLNNVIGAVGTTTFQNVVTLVLAGHENYNGANVDYLIDAVQGLQTTLAAANLGKIPVSSALVSGDLVSPPPNGDIERLVASYSAAAPLAFDPYPFQWGTWPADQAVTNATLTNSIAWDYSQVKSQSFYTPPRPILMAETGWATAGTGQYANYYCYQQQNCKPGVTNAATYLRALYGFVKNPLNTAGALVFEAYDEPAKDPSHPNDAENFYGVFDADCKLKNSNTNLLPNTVFVPGVNLGCQGFTQGVYFSVAGTQPGSTTNQPPFIVTMQQTNPSTSRPANMTVTVPNQDRSNLSVTPWPYFLIFDGATVTITGQTSGASCTFTAAVSAPNAPTWTRTSCSNPNYLVNCSGSVCYLPWNNF